VESRNAEIGDQRSDVRNQKLNVNAEHLTSK